MPPWKQIPFVRILPFFLAGIGLQNQFHFPLYLISWLALTPLLLLLFFSFQAPGRQFHWSWLPPTSIYTLLLTTGCLVMELQQRKTRNALPSWPPATYTLRLEDEWKEAKNSFRNKILVFHQGKYIKAWLYTPKDSQFLHLKPGSWISAQVSPKAISPPANPGAFDYRSYCLPLGVTHQLYLKAGQYHRIKTEEPKGLSPFLRNIQSRVLAILRRSIPDKAAAGLAEALLIGYKGDLDKDTETIYAQTGVVHIIAISGMHLGLIYGLLLLLFKPLNQHRYGRWARSILIILTLWLFSLLVGGSPSVLRSAVMFTAILLGEAIGRKGNAINSLAFSAFALLCYQPYWISDIGFQLSFAAVSSILLFYPILYKFFDSPWSWLDMVWKLIAVTLAAQVLTFPLCVYHFHQFPVWFLAANLVAVPLSNIILLGEIGLCAISFWDQGADTLGLILSQLIRWMNQWVALVSQWPGSVWEPLQISWSQALILLAMVTLPLFQITPGKKIKGALLLLLIFLTERTLSFYHARHQQRIIVYAIPNTRAMDIQWGESFLFLGDSLIRQKKGAYPFHVRPARIQYRMSREKEISGQEPRILKWNGEIIGIFSGPFEEAVNIPQLDVLILSNNSGMDGWRDYLKTNPPKLVVLDASNSFRIIAQWKKGLQALNIPVFDLREKGHWVWKRE